VPEDDPWAYADALDQAAAVRAGEVTPVELVEAAIARITALNPSLGAVVYERFERAREEAAGPLPDGPLRGVPFLVKDAVQHSRGDRYQHGLRLLRDHPYVSPDDTELMARYRRAGVVLLGRTTVPELTLSTTTEPRAHPPARNPWDPSRSTGGSSGGSAAAVAAGMVAAAHGNDMGGSIRIPASCCGLVGLKPSRHRTSPAPLHGEYWGPLTHEHVLTWTVRDSAAFLDATAGAVAGDLHVAPAPVRPWLEAATTSPPRVRVGVLLDRPDGGSVHEECRTAVQSAADLLVELGHEVVAVDAPEWRDDEGFGAFTTLLAVAVAKDVAHWERVTGASAELEAFSATLLEAGRSTSAVDLGEAVDRLATWSRRIARGQAELDLLLTPTMAVLPPLLGTVSDEAPLDVALLGQLDMSVFAIPFNVTGQPAISLPLHTSREGLPVGVQLAAGYGREDLLLSVAAELEQARPWAGRRPPVVAGTSSTQAV
jgi:amidase